MNIEPPHTLKHLCATFTELDEQRIRLLLTDAGIPFVCNYRGSGSVMRILSGSAFFGCDFYVSLLEYPRAIAVTEMITE